MVKTLICGILLFIVLSVLDLKLSKIASKSISVKLFIFFLILTLLFLAVSGISDEFKVIPEITAMIMIMCLVSAFIGRIFKITKSKLDGFLIFSLLMILICEGYVRLDPNGRILYWIFDRMIDVKQIEIIWIIGFIILLSIKVFGGIFFKKELSFIDKRHFQVKDGKGK